MYSLVKITLKYLRYFFTSSNGKGHGVHSPFVFDFIKNVLNDNRHFYAYQYAEEVRKKMLMDERELTIQDFGAGSSQVKGNKRKVSSIARSSLKPPKYGQLLFRMVNYYQPASVVELGTSLGVTTAYLALANTSVAVNTMEGATEIADIALENFSGLALSNINLVKGNFDDTLQQVLSQYEHIEFAFIDGNHRKEPTLNYFEQLLARASEKSVFIFDDIHWSKPMEEAWQQIIKHPSVTLSIDLFFIGLVFFRPEQQKKQDFAIRF